MRDNEDDFDPHGPDNSVPRATYISAMKCPSLPATHIHIILKDHEGNWITQATVDQSMLDGWQVILNRSKMRLT